MWNYTRVGQLENLPFQPKFEFHGEPLVLFLKAANGPWESIEIFLTRVMVQGRICLIMIWPLKVIIENGATDVGWLQKRKWSICSGNNSGFGV